MQIHNRNTGADHARIAETFVIIGASPAGVKAAQALREEGFTARIVLIGAETERPYERPPLSKGSLWAGGQGQTVCPRRGWYGENSVELQLGRRVASLDRAGHQVELEGGDRFGCSKLLLAQAPPRASWIYRVLTWTACTTYATSRTPSGRARPSAAGPGRRGRCRLDWAGDRGTGQVAVVVIDDGSEILTDVVIVGVGAQPSTWDNAAAFQACLRRGGRRA